MLGAGAKLPANTETSTLGSETVAGAIAVVRSAFPINSLLEQVYERDVPLELGADNETAELDISKGWSKNMKHLRKHQRLSIGQLGEAVDRDDAELRHLPRGSNTTGTLTEGLLPIQYAKYRRGLGIGDPSEFGDEPDIE